MSVDSTRAAAPRARRKRAAPVRPRKAAPAEAALPHTHSVALPPEWREFVGRWLESAGCTLKAAARGDWEVELSADLQRRWRRQRVRLVFDPLRATLPRGAWFTAPGSGAGRRILDAATGSPMVSRVTALARVPGAPENGLAAVCRVRGLTWGAPRLGPVHYERRISLHAVVTRWGGLPSQEPWILLFGAGEEPIEWTQGLTLPEVRTRDGLYQISADLSLEERTAWMTRARNQLEKLLGEREEEWSQAVERLREDELDRLGAFFSSRIEEEEERLRRRTGNSDESEIEYGDATSLKLEWERRAAEVRQRWALRTEIRLWGLVEWSWPVADLDQELRSGAVHVRLSSRVDVARALPALPACPGCGTPAEMLVRSRGHVACSRCA